MRSRLAPDNKREERRRIAMAIDMLKRTMRGHCAKCGGKIVHKPEVEKGWFKCNDCGAYQPRKASTVTHDHAQVALHKARLASGLPSHRQARRKGHVAA